MYNVARNNNYALFNQIILFRVIKDMLGMCYGCLLKIQ